MPKWLSAVLDRIFRRDRPTPHPIPRLPVERVKPTIVSATATVRLVPRPKANEPQTGADPMTPPTCPSLPPELREIGALINAYGDAAWRRSMADAAKARAAIDATLLPYVQDAERWRAFRLLGKSAEAMDDIADTVVASARAGEEAQSAIDYLETLDDAARSTTPNGVALAVAPTGGSSDAER